MEIAAFSDFSLVVTVKAHYVTGGLGSLVAELIAERHFGCELVRCGVRAVPTATPEANPISTLVTESRAMRSLRR